MLVESVKKAAVLGLVLALLLTASTGVSVDVVNANFTPLPDLPIPVYIKADGSIEGGDGALVHEGNYYYLVKNSTETISIQRDNIILDGNDFTLTKPPEIETVGLMTPVGWFPQIQIQDRCNVTIRNLRFDGCYTGLSIARSTNIVIIKNTVCNAHYGIVMSTSDNCKIVGNLLYGNEHAGLSIRDLSALDLAYNVISGNGWHGAWITIGASNIYRNNFTNNIGPHGDLGLYCYGTNSDNRIFENNFVGNEVGLSFQNGSNNTLYDNYWRNHRENLAGGLVDVSPLDGPVDISFDSASFPELNPIPIHTTEPSDSSESTQPSLTPEQTLSFLTYPDTYLWLAAFFVCLSVGLFVVIKLKRRFH